MTEEGKASVDLHSWQMAAIEHGLRDAEAGRLVAHADVVAWVESWGSADELPMPEPNRRPGESVWSRKIGIIGLDWCKL
jgi:hypothetical protein